MPKSILARIIIGFTLTLSTLLVVSLISLGSIDALRKAGKDQYEWAVLTKELVDIIPAVLLAESGRRGYILSRDPSALEIYYEGVKSTQNELKQVQGLVREYPMFLDRVAELSRIVDQKMVNLSDSMSVFQRDPKPEFQNLYTTNGILLTQKIRSSIEALTNEIYNESEQREAVVLQRSGAAKGIILLIGFLALVGVCSAVYVISRQLKARVLFEKKQAELIEQLTHALGEVKTLSGLLPICASCKKIRSDSGYWTQIEVYLTEHSDAHFSHGLCEECAARLYPDLYVPKEIREKRQNQGAGLNDLPETHKPVGGKPV